MKFIQKLTDLIDADTDTKDGLCKLCILNGALICFIVVLSAVTVRDIALMCDAVVWTKPDLPDIIVDLIGITFGLIFWRVTLKVIAIKEKREEEKDETL